MNKGIIKPERDGFSRVQPVEQFCSLTSYQKRDIYELIFFPEKHLPDQIENFILECDNIGYYYSRVGTAIGPGSCLPVTFLTGNFEGYLPWIRQLKGDFLFTNIWPDHHICSGYKARFMMCFDVSPINKLELLDSISKIILINGPEQNLFSQVISENKELALKIAHNFLINSGEERLTIKI